MHCEFLVEEAHQESELNKKFSEVQIEQITKLSLNANNDLYSLLYDTEGNIKVQGATLALNGRNGFNILEDGLVKIE